MIRKLPPQVIQQIAAGEVIERPASVAKELIENAIDAGARRISIEYEEGGLQSLSLEDDGKGMSEAELPLSVEPHATSKLQKFEDLMKMGTLGFRGEALASMASVAEVEIWTAEKESETGYRLCVSNGAEPEISAAEKRVGTKISVRHLFREIPARRKFLKSALSEARQILQVVRRYALAYPELGFEVRDLKAKRPKVLLEPSSHWERSLWFFDESEPSCFFELHEEPDENWGLRLISKKTRYVYGGRGNFQLFLNQRPIRDRQLEAAIRRGFEGYCEKPGSLSLALFLKAPLDLVDINVHPAKSEVRFLRGDTFFAFIVRQIRKHLETEHQQTTAVYRSTSQLQAGSAGELPNLERVNQSKLSFAATRVRTPVWSSNESFAPPTEPVEEESSASLGSPSEFQVQESSSDKFEYLGSIDNTYLIAKTGEALFLFDQHALHERVLYEELMEEFKRSKRLSSQRLLFPQTLKFAGADALLGCEAELEELGFEVRAWKEEHIQLVAAPAVLKANYDQVLQKFLEVAEESKQSMLRDFLATLACHSAVRAHDLLVPEKARYLLEAFEKQDAVGHCPHGRPTYIPLKAKDLERMFHRTGV